MTRRTSNIKPLFFHISNELLLKSYKEAVKLGLHEDFISLLEKEIRHRNLKK